MVGGGAGGVTPSSVPTATTSANSTDPTRRGCTTRVSGVGDDDGGVADRRDEGVGAARPDDGGGLGQPHRPRPLRPTVGPGRTS